MPLILQGQWTVNVKVKNPISLPQRFIISNATTGNGTFDGFVGATPVNVSGASWLLNIQANEDYELNGAWINSSVRKTQTRQENGFFVFEVESEDLIQDNSWDDLVLEFRQQIPLPPPPPTPVPDPEPPVVIVPQPDPPTPTTPVPAPEPLMPGKVYTRFGFDEMFKNKRIDKSYSIWSEGTGSLLFFHTSSLQNENSASLSIYNKPFGSCGSTRMFDIAYGNINGSGSLDMGGGKDYFTLSNAVYSQYANLTNNTVFSTPHKEIKHFYAINVARDRYGDSLDLNQTEINIKSLSGSFVPNNVHTGSNVKINPSGPLFRLIDDGNSYIVSGSLEQGIYNPTNPHIYGLIYPKLGVWLLDADVLDMSASFNTVTGSDISGNNKYKLFTALSGSALYTDDSGDYLGLKSRKFKSEYLDKYFVRIKNFDYNHSNNPTWVTGSEQIIKDEFSKNPQTFITEIGLYDDNYVLMAVGKINLPKPKNYSKEGLYTVTLKYD